MAGESPDDPISGEDLALRTESYLRRYLSRPSSETDALFERLSEAFLPFVRNHPIYRALRQWMSPDDVLQEFWMVLLRRDGLRKFQDRGLGSLRGYLKVYLDHVMVDLLRRYTRIARGGNESFEDLDNSAFQLRDERPGPSTEIGGSEFLTHCRDKLPAPQAMVWELHVEQGLGFADIAKKLDTTESAVRGQVYRAIRKLIDRAVLRDPKDAGSE